MNRSNVILRLLMAAAVMAAVVLLAGCQAAAPVEVAQLPPIATTTVPADTPAPAAPAATETKPVVNTATVPVQEREAPVAPTETLIPPAAGSEAAVAAAVAHLAQHLGLDEQDILVQIVEAVDWPDSSLGCPQKGMMYLQVITPGYQVMLRLEEQTYDYRVAGQQVILCHDSQ